MLLIKKIRIIDPETKLDAIKDVLIEENIVKAISDEIETDFLDEDTLIIDGEGLMAGPGLVDIHVHFRDPGFTYKEDIETGAKAALAGGFTSVICMANTKPAVDSEETLRYIQEKAAKTDINIYQAACVSEGMKGEKAVDFEKLHKAGAVGFTDDGVPIMDEGILRQALEYSEKTNMPVSLHEEDPQYISGAGVNASEIAKKFDIKGASCEAEITMVQRDIEIAKAVGGVLNIQHISAKESVDLVRQAIKDEKGERKIHAEATPHHFSLTEEAVLKHETLAKMNPPLRTIEDKAAIIEGLKDGTIDLIATDHAPHSEEEKNKPFSQAPSGIIGLETSFGLVVKNLVEPGHLDYIQLFEKMSYNPAKLYNIDAGRLQEGSKADIIIFDPYEEWIFSEEDISSKSKNTPFIGYKLKGRIKAVIVGGILHKM